MENNENMNVVELSTEDLEAVSGGKGASQRVKATGDVRVRREPNLDGAEIGILYSGDKAEFLGEIKTDRRGVDWYKVKFHGHKGWVSSKYSKIVKKS